MGAGKSIDALKVVHNYSRKGMRALLFTSAIDDRYELGKVKSRIGIEKDAIIINEDTDIVARFLNENEYIKVDCIVVDESNFLKKHHIEQLREIVDEYDTPVIAYGLKNTYKNTLFEGSKWLLVYADKIEELKTICFCGKKACTHLKIRNGNVVKEGMEDIEVGGDELYHSVCHKHYKEGRWK